MTKLLPASVSTQSQRDLPLTAHAVLPPGGDDADACWVSLPDDLLYDAFRRLSPQELARVACVCLDWRRNADTVELWRPHAAALRRPTVTGEVADLKAACRHAVLAEANLCAGRVTATRQVRH